MALLAQATEAELAHALDTFRPLPDHSYARPPEIGLIMLQGRIGGDGQRFDLGEATVTRCVVAMADGSAGVSYLLGRAPRRARYAAMLDAMAQQPGGHARLEALLLDPLRQRLAREADLAERQTAATRVEFFTVAAGRR
jgi:alpha-D-ribose 1-methylphosphonate 5-triphosphate synthase subunit PhnG